MSQDKHGLFQKEQERKTREQPHVVMMMIMDKEKTSTAGV